MVGAIKTVCARRTRRGAVALEYALVLAFVAIGVLASLVTLGDNVTGAIDKHSSTVGQLPDKMDFK